MFEALATLIDPGDEVSGHRPLLGDLPRGSRLRRRDNGPRRHLRRRPGYLAAIDQLEAATTRPHQAADLRLALQPDRGRLPTRPGGRHRLRGPPSVGYGSSPTRSTHGWCTETPRFTSIPVAAPEGRPQTVVVSGVAKSYAMTGWRVGWIIAPNDVAAAAANLQSHLSSNVANVAQAAALAALTGPQDEVEAMREAFDRRRRTAYSMLSKVPDMECPEPLGAFYLFPSVAGVLERGVGGQAPGDIARTVRPAPRPGRGGGRARRGLRDPGRISALLRPRGRRPRGGPQSSRLNALGGLTCQRHTGA